MSWTPALRVAAAVAVVVVYGAIRGGGALRYRWRSAGAHAAVAATGLAAFALLAVPVALLSGLVRWEPVALPVPEVLLLAGEILLLTALPQEMLFRGLLFAGLQKAMRGRWGPHPALVISSAIFALAHVPMTTDGIYLVLSGVAGIAYGWCYLRTGSLAPGVMVHTSVNLLHQLVLTTPSP